MDEMEIEGEMEREIDETSARESEHGGNKAKKGNTGKHKDRIENWTYKNTSLQKSLWAHSHMPISTNEATFNDDADDDDDEREKKYLQHNQRYSQSSLILEWIASIK